MNPVSFDNTKVAFSYKSDKELRNAKWLFKAINMPYFSKLGMRLALWANKLRLPNKTPMMQALYNQFCGGATVDEAYERGTHLMQYRVGIILDYSVEANSSEEAFDQARDEFLDTIQYASLHSGIPFISIKLTGLARFELLEKLHAQESLTLEEQEEWERAKTRVEDIVRMGVASRIRVLVDAEESWIQSPINTLLYQLMKTYNVEEAWVFNTYQLYLSATLENLKEDLRCAAKHKFVLGAKLVRGAYMEKERARASKMDYESPVQVDKASTDRDFNEALLQVCQNIKNAELFIGTHNEYSCLRATELMDAFKVSPERMCFSQLYGMSDHISFNLAAAGYMVVKYLPYGPIQDAIPYLLRRAQENTSVKGQSSRELQLIETEISRRKKFKKAIKN